MNWLAANLRHREYVEFEKPWIFYPAELKHFTVKHIVFVCFQSTSYHVANLRAYCPYFFRVSAENKHGLSVASERSEVVVTKDRKTSLRLSIDSDGKQNHLL